MREVRSFGNFVSGTIAMYQNRLKNHRLFQENGKWVLSIGNESYFLPPIFLKTFLKFRAPARVANTNAFKRFSLDLTEFDEFMKMMEQKGWLTQNDIDSKNLNEGAVAEIIESAITMCKQRLYLEVTQRALADRQSCLFYLLEQIWFISQASVYLGKGVQAVDGNFALHQIIKTYCDEEANHYKPIIKSLGITEAQLKSHRANRGTIILLNHLCQLAQENPIGLIICCALFEAESTSREVALEFFDECGRVAGLDLREMYEHMRIDLDAGHAELWKEVLLAAGPCSKADLDAHLDDLFTSREIIQTWNQCLIEGMNHLDPGFQGVEPTLTCFLQPKAEARDFWPNESGLKE